MAAYSAYQIWPHVPRIMNFIALCNYSVFLMQLLKTGAWNYCSLKRVYLMKRHFETITEMLNIDINFRTLNVQISLYEPRSTRIKRLYIMCFGGGEHFSRYSLKIHFLLINFNSLNKTPPISSLFLWLLSNILSTPWKWWGACLWLNRKWGGGLSPETPIW